MRKKLGDPEINMTPMIDVVFQMIIFFVCTAELDKQTFDENVILEWAKSGQEVEEVHPLTVTVNIRDDGLVTIGGTGLSIVAYRQFMRTMAGKYGGQNIPVVIRGDRNSKHAHIKAIMDVCKGVGIWKVSFAAIKQEG